MEKLRQYIADSGSPAICFAKRIGTSPGYLCDLLSGRRKPSMKMACVIARETGDKVPISTWLRDETAAV